MAYIQLLAATLISLVEVVKLTHTRAPTRSAVRTWLKKKENPGMYLLTIRDQDIIIHSSIDNFFMQTQYFHTEVPDFKSFLLPCPPARLTWICGQLSLILKRCENGSPLNQFLLIVSRNAVTFLGVDLFVRDLCSAYLHTRRDGGRQAAPTTFMEEHAATRKHDHLDDIHDTYDGCMIMLIIFTWVVCVCVFSYSTTGECFLHYCTAPCRAKSPRVHLHCIYLVRMACLARVGGRTPEVHATAAWRLHA